MTGKVRRALISVYDKTGLVDLGRYLADQGVELLSTGGSAAMLRENNVAVTEVSDHTGFPEIMDGRVKTLHPKIHGGILARRDNAGDRASMTELDIEGIDLVVVNLYPFEATVASGADYATCIENIDIGGPAMIRAAAKNHADVSVAVDPNDYGRLVEEMAANKGATTLEFRTKLAAKAYRHTAGYDAAIGSWFASEAGEQFPEQLVLSGRLKQTLRYGENPHQAAALYETSEDRFGVATAEQLQGKELSFNNLNDTDAAFELAAEFDQPACAIIKHANPCGVAIGDNLTEAYKRALACDTESAFGGIVALNGVLDGPTAEEIAKLFAEVIIAPEISDEAREILGAKKNLRVLRAGGMPNPKSGGYNIRTLAGGLLVQGRDAAIIGDDLKTVTKRAPTDQEMTDLLFAFTICKHVKSNAIIYCKNGATVGVGAGQMSRVNSTRIASW
ncbi:MAG: bifunctional phosphoribosylaminoimidazolecarboxamide formyltransferase/IMP cyclohydrolase, partial [Proteobacteria bacterium]|nr:bifunctional phosphoribosylaminoimidazolecarboxamide formyltransferase/IMP cyclohydrolase [Pseudomonadota bacterium]